jgi:hypothetical protein
VGRQKRNLSSNTVTQAEMPRMLLGITLAGVGAVMMPG